MTDDLTESFLEEELFDELDKIKKKFDKKGLKIKKISVEYQG